MNSVLVVDDEVTVTIQLQERLQRMGYRVVGTAHSGAQAVSMAKRHGPDVVLMDIVMPGVTDGIDASERIRSELDIPVIFVTAYADKKLVDRAKHVEPFGYIVKPFHENEIVAAIELAIHKKAVEKKLRKTQQTLRNSERFHRMLFNNTNDAVLLHRMVSGEPDKTLEVNDGALRMLGYSRKALLALHPLQLVDSAEREKILERVQQVHSRSSLLFESHLIAKNGRKVPVEINARLFTLRGQSVMLVGARDITERKRSEKRLREAEAELKRTIELVPGIIATANAQTGHFTQCNPALTRILGFSSEEFLARPFIEFVHPDDRQSTIDEVEKQLKGAPVACFENRYVCKDGSYKWLEWRATAADEKGAVYAAGTDITERKRVEQALQERVKELDCLYNISHLTEKADATLADILQRTVNLIPLSWHYPEAVCTSITLDGEEYYSHDRRRYRQAEQRQSSDILVHGKVAGSVNVCYLEERPEADEGPFLKEEQRLLDAIANRLGIVIERFRAEEAEEKLLKAIETAAEAINITSAEGILTYANEATCTLFGYKQKELIGKSPAIFNAGPDPEAVVKEVIDAIKTEGFWQGEVLNKKKDGTEFTTYARVSATKDEKGRVLNFISTQHDITERKKTDKALRESEERFRTLINGSNDMIAINLVDENGPVKILEVNDGMVHMLGYSKEELVGKHPFELIEPLGQDKISRIMKSFNEKGHATFEATFISKDGKRIPVELNSRRLELHDKRIEIGVGRDITDRKKSELELARHRDHLKKLVEERTQQLIMSERLSAAGRLAAGFAHEINSPLQGMLSHLELIWGVIPEKSTRIKNYEHVKANITKISNIVKQLLDIYGKPDSITSHVNVNDLIHKTAGLIKHQLEIKKILLNFIPNESLPEIPGDEQQLHQVILNLLINAMDSIGTGGEISISVSYENENVKIQIKDDGEGMNEIDQGHIFEPFYSTKEAAGTGLGLFVCQGLIENHRGELKVESVEGEGSVFTIILPGR